MAIKPEDFTGGLIYVNFVRGQWGSEMARNLVWSGVLGEQAEKGWLHTQ
jgi:hypothetical protein